MSVSTSSARVRAEFWDNVRRNGELGGSRMFAVKVPLGELKGKSVLDVGCGGSDVTGASNAARLYVGLDISREAVKLLRSEFKWVQEFEEQLAKSGKPQQEKPPSRNVVRADASALDMIGDNSFDVVMSSDTITPAGELGPVILKNMARISRNLVIFVVSHVDMAREISKAKEAQFEDGTLFLESDTSRWCIDKAGLAKMLERLGLEARKVEVITQHDYDFLSTYPLEQINYAPCGEVKNRIYVEAVKKV